jgi:hypothetical protein
LIAWSWYFWIGAVLIAIAIITSYFTIPSDMALVRARGLKMDWKGSVLIASGVVVLTVAITDSSYPTDGNLHYYDEQCRNALHSQSVNGLITTHKDILNIIQQLKDLNATREQLKNDL